MRLSYLVVLTVFFSPLWCWLSEGQSERRDAILKENEKPGNSSWWLPQLPYYSLIEGFTTEISYLPMERVRFKLSCEGSYDNFTIEVYRLGYYGGAGARHVTTLSVNSAQCAYQPKCLYVSDYRLTDCRNWQLGAEWLIPITAVSGVYVGLPIIRQTGNHAAVLAYGNYIPFVVKQPPHQAPSEILFKTSDLTWVAYNKYGGWNLYAKNGSKDFSTRAFAASYNRPFTNRFRYPYGMSQNFLFSTEYPFLRWLEKYGYDVSYVACKDLEKMRFSRHLPARKHPLLPRNSPIKPGVKAILSVGHDEYWTPALHSALRRARDSGVSLGFFSGNEGYWRVLWEEDYSKHLQGVRSNASSYLPHSAMLLSFASHRVIVCHKHTITNTPALSAALYTGTFPDPRQPSFPLPPLSAQLFLVNAYRADRLSVPRELLSLRAWRNVSAGLEHDGSYLSAPGILGYEWDVYVSDLLRVPGSFPVSLTRMQVAQALAQDWGAAYRGSGVAEHRVAMYRYDPLRTHSHVFARGNNRVNAAKDSSKQASSVCSALSINTTTASFDAVAAGNAHSHTSVVVGVGTIQWAWALSGFRDGDACPPDAALQQATLNLLADMHVLPHASFRRGAYLLDRPVAAKNGADTQNRLVFPAPSTDFLAPIATIHTATTKRSSAAQPLVFRMAGEARDRGGGRVACVEVSLDGGASWSLADGAYDSTAEIYRWSYEYCLEPLSPAAPPPPPLRAYGLHYPAYNLSSRLSSPHGDDTLHVLRAQLFASPRVYAPWRVAPTPSMNFIFALVRAVDDSGNVENIDVAAHICRALRVLREGEGADVDGRGMGRLYPLHK
eukprot:gene26517-32044_t